MKNVKKIAKIAMVCAVVAFMPKACHMSHVCDVVESIPENAKEFIWRDHPECYNIDLLAEYWEKHHDEVLHEMACEQEFERYHQEHDCITDWED